MIAALLTLTLGGSIALASAVESIGPALGGGTSVVRQDANAFSQPAANMPLSARLDFSVGNSFFRNPWVVAPSSTQARDGLGPLFNTNACQNCHIKDGRGHPPQSPQDNAVSMLVRLSIPGTDSAPHRAARARLGAVPEPRYGLQLQDMALPDVPAEAQVVINYEESELTLADGVKVAMRRPRLELAHLAYGPLASDATVSARIATPMIGLGLLAAIPEVDLVAQADAADADGDGISGRPNRVWDETRQSEALGRFGWKAGQPSLRQQNAAAFHGDLGITSNLLPDRNCTSVQRSCLASPSGGQPEVSERILDQVTFYTQNLAVPARRDADKPAVVAGEKLFRSVGCADCHTPTWHTGDAEFSWLSGEKIHPFSDLLLHDMGEDLADHREEFAANGREWRTPPLWGIGLTQAVTGHAFYLHDGRARTLLEAILWHGGEAQASRDGVVAMNAKDRNSLLAFLRSL